MFRRALQVITRDLLGAKPGNLANELKADLPAAAGAAAVGRRLLFGGAVVRRPGLRAQPLGAAARGPANVGFDALDVAPESAAAQALGGVLRDINRPVNGTR